MENKFIKNEELKKGFTDEKTGISYTLKGDYYVPNIIPPEAIDYSKLNKYGRARLRFLKEHRRAEYTIMFIDETLNKHLQEVQNIAYEKLEYLINEMKQKENLTEEMKNTDPLRWTGIMNSIKASAEEVIYSELIYV